VSSLNIEVQTLNNDYQNEIGLPFRDKEYIPSPTIKAVISSPPSLLLKQQIA
jgi:hypothetical protein